MLEIGEMVISAFIGLIGLGLASMKHTMRLQSLSYLPNFTVCGYKIVRKVLTCNVLDAFSGLPRDRVPYFKPRGLCLPCSRRPRRLAGIVSCMHKVMQHIIS